MLKYHMYTYTYVFVYVHICMYMTRNRSWNRNRSRNRHRSRNRNRIQIICRNRNRKRLQIFRFRNPAWNNVKLYFVNLISDSPILGSTSMWLDWNIDSKWSHIGIIRLKSATQRFNERCQRLDTSKYFVGKHILYMLLKDASATSAAPPLPELRQSTLHRGR
jgi:hypothetical protein